MVYVDLAEFKDNTVGRTVETLLSEIRGDGPAIPLSHPGDAKEVAYFKQLAKTIVAACIAEVASSPSAAARLAARSRTNVFSSR